MSTCEHCGIVRVHITLFFQCLSAGTSQVYPKTPQTGKYRVLA
jgi:hypothetical protein